MCVCVLLFSLFFILFSVVAQGYEGQRAFADMHHGVFVVLTGGWPVLVLLCLLKQGELTGSVDGAACITQ